MAPVTSKSALSSGHSRSFQDRSLIPVGMTTILPRAAKQVRSLEAQLMAHIGQWGYDEIILPTFEYLDVLAPGLEAELLETCYQFVDRTTGRTLLLRPDATAQVARTIAMGLTGATFPQRLFYRTSVFRYEPEHAGRGREIFQVGAELIGVDNVEGDIEVITLLIECLRPLNLPQLTVALGHVGFIKGLLAKSGLSSQGRKRAEQAAARKDLPKLEEVLTEEKVHKSFARAIREAPELIGQEEVLKRGRMLAGRDRELLAPLERLGHLYSSLCSAGYRDSLLLDLGEFRGFDYYDGIVFDVFAAGLGVELGGGGRYDHLIGRFGVSTPSTGFALDVDRLFRAMKFSDDIDVSADLDYLVVGTSQLMERANTIAKRLRDAGRRVASQIIRGDKKQLLDQACHAGLRQRAHTVVVIGMTGVGQRSVVTVQLPLDSSDGGRNGKVLRSCSRQTTLDALIRSASEAYHRSMDGAS